jgi:hypothetical protein
MRRLRTLCATRTTLCATRTTLRATLTTLCAMLVAVAGCAGNAPGGRHHVQSDAPDSVAGRKGLAERYSGMTDLRRDPAVLFADDAESATGDALLIGFARDHGPRWNNAWDHTWRTIRVTRDPRHVHTGRRLSEPAFPDRGDAEDQSRRFRSLRELAQRPQACLARRLRRGHRLHWSHDARPLIHRDALVRRRPCAIGVPFVAGPCVGPSHTRALPSLQGPDMAL